MKKKLKRGTIVVVNIPFEYEIGETGFFTDRELFTKEDCIEETKAEIQSDLFDNNMLYFEAEVLPARKF